VAKDLPMSIADFRAHALAGARKLAEMGVPIFCARLMRDGEPDRRDKRWLGWQRTEAGNSSLAAIESWKPGNALCAVMGVACDALDPDIYKPEGKKSLKQLMDAVEADSPELWWQVETPSGGRHYLIDRTGLGSHNDILPSLDLKGGRDDGTSRGFIFLPPTERPSKVTGEVRAYRELAPLRQMNGHGNIQGLRKFLARQLEAGREPDGNGGGARQKPSALAAAALAAGDGGQRGALMAYVAELEKRGYERDDIVTLVRTLVSSPEWKNFPSDDGPWWPARRGNPDRWLQSLLHKPGTIIPDARGEEAAELQSLAGYEPPRSEDPDEIAFWEARPVLGHIREWARARRASPWAVLGECLAEAVCHIPAAVQLPPLVGGDGTLNMLIAMTGKSGAGKNAAARAARAAFKWSGVIGIVEDDVPRIPLGTGEGLSRSFGHNGKDDEGIRCLVRDEESVIITIGEIDTYKALHERSGSTISAELRKFYSGETLGFGYGDPAKRVIIPEHEYRGCVIAGVQPGKGEIILNDADSGFPQRWLWLPANDPAAPDSQPEEPEAWEWMPPESAYGPFVMKVCGDAIETIDKARLDSLRGQGNDMDSHSLYTREKIAAGLALLESRDSVTKADWELSGFVMSVSDRTRAIVVSHLVKKAHESNVERGRAEAVRREVTDAALHESALKRVSRNVLKHVTGRAWISARELRRRIAQKDREMLPEALENLVQNKVLLSREHVYRGQTGTQYRKAPRR
jgi:hypothetical protein